MMECPDAEATLQVRYHLTPSLPHHSLSTTDWIKETVARSPSEDMEAESPNDELNSNYEIYDVT